MASAFPRWGLFWGISRRESASLCREQLLGHDGGGDVAQAKIILSANVPVQRLPRRLGIRLLGGAGDIHADRAWCAFLMHGDVYARLASIGDAPLIQQQFMDDSPPIVSPWSEIQKRRPPILKLAKEP